jgi:hypothetical protein
VLLSRRKPGLTITISNMLIGKWWLRPTKAALDVSTTEHALVARRVMLRMDPDAARFTQIEMFDALTPAESAEFKAQDVPVDALDFLSRRNDPRVYAIREWGWVRVRRDRFYLWKFDRRALRTIRSSSGYWSAQPNMDPNDATDVIELSSADEFSIPLSTLRNPAMDVKSLLELASRTLAARRQR